MATDPFLQGIEGNALGAKHVLFGNSSALPNPQRTITGLDSATESQMNQKEQHANETPEQMAAEMQQGVQQDSGAAFRDQGLLSQAQGGGGAPMAGAIQARQQKNYLRDVNGIKRQAEYQAPLQKQQEMQSVMQDKVTRANAAAGIADRDRQQQLANWQQNQNSIAARRQVIGSLFGAAGAVMGGYLGGAGGAKAGNSAGQGMVGGTQQSTSMSTGESYGGAGNLA